MKKLMFKIYLQAFCVLLMILVFPVQELNAQRLKNVKNDIKEDKSSNDKKSSRSTSSSSRDDLMLEIFYLSIRKVLAGNLEHSEFNSYPYANGINGEYCSSCESNVSPSFGKLFVSNTLSAFDLNLYSNNTRLNWRMSPYLGVDVNYLHLKEFNPSDDLGFMSAMLDFYRLRWEAASFYYGIGVTYAGSSVDEAGLAYQLGLNIYPEDPLSAEIFYKQSFINEISVDELKVMLNYHVNRSSLGLGLSHLKIASFKTTSIGFELKHYVF
jgi:hypothetical protein